MTIHSRAPLRIDFAGAWTDLPWYAEREGGTVVNAAITLSVRVDFLLGDRRIRLHTEDTDDHVTVESSGHLAYDGKLDRHKAALNMLPVTGGIEILARCDAPLGADLGESASLDTALLAGLARCRQEEYEPTELADLGFMLESSELGLTGWRQNHYSAAMGGFLQLEFGRQGVAVRRLSVSDEAARELSEHLVIVHTGRSHFSSQVHSRVRHAYDAGDARVVEAMRSIRDVARQVGDVAEAADWRRLARLMDESWGNQRLLDDTMSTPAMMQIEEAVRGAGAWGLKATGAGAGGCLVIVCPPVARSRVAGAAMASGGELLEFDFTADGLAVWSQKDATQQS